MTGMTTPIRLPRDERAGHRVVYEQKVQAYWKNVGEPQEKPARVVEYVCVGVERAA